MVEDDFVSTLNEAMYYDGRYVIDCYAVICYASYSMSQDIIFSKFLLLGHF